MQKIVFFIILLLISKQVFCQDKSIGYWTGTMIRDNSAMTVAFEFEEQKKEVVGFFNSASQRASGISLDSIVSIDDTIRFQLMSDPITYFTCSVFINKIIGQFTQEGLSEGTISLICSVKPEAEYNYTDTTFINGGNKIACRIYFPKGDEKFPAVVFMHGSGGEGMYANQ